jgi:4'-phosphopantetheinyl transferase
MINIWYCNISNIGREKFDSYLSRLPQEQRSNICRYHSFKDKALRLGGKILLMKALTGTGFSNELINGLKKTDTNKPFLENWMPFNISHSGDYVVLAFGSDSEIGVDIEFIDPGTETSELLDFFVQEEKELLLRCAGVETFFDIWVRKEAVLKAAGIGIVNGLNMFSCISDIVHYNGKKWFLKKNHIAEDYISYLATSSLCEDVLMSEITL